MLAFSDCLWMGILMFIYCDLLEKSWFPYLCYKHALLLATLWYIQPSNLSVALARPRAQLQSEWGGIEGGVVGHSNVVVMASPANLPGPLRRSNSLVLCSSLVLKTRCSSNFRPFCLSNLWQQQKKANYHHSTCLPKKMRNQIWLWGFKIL